MIDGGLRKEFHKRIRPCHWTAIETGAVGVGVPDSHYCLPGGVAGWIEFKKTDPRADMQWSWQPGQFAWAKAHVSMGGRWLLAVRRKTLSVPIDQLWMFTLNDIDNNGMPHNSIMKVPTMNALFGGHGPASWEWDRVIILMSRH